MTAADTALDSAESLLRERRLDEALIAIEHAEILGADCNVCSGLRWSTAMLNGDFEAAWQQSDLLRDRNAPDPHRFWKREEICGKHLIIRCLHGFGDTVQMLRFAPRLRTLAASVVYEVAPHFLPLAGYFAGVENAVTWGPSISHDQPEWNVQAEIMEIPYLLRLQPGELPAAERYLHLPFSEIIRVAAAMGHPRGQRIGFAWTCGQWDLSRAVSADLVPLLVAQPGMDLWSLESSSKSSETSALGLRDSTAICGEGLLPLAATIANLDLVITVDTLAAHLAGGLGKPTWLLLKHAADWRWQHERTDSPWYPSLRLFRQPAPGDWASVIAEVQQELQVLVASNP